MSILSEGLKNTESTSFDSGMLAANLGVALRPNLKHSSYVQISQMTEPDFHNDLRTYLAL